jgi:hypothetical protein
VLDSEKIDTIQLLTGPMFFNFFVQNGNSSEHFNLKPNRNYQLQGQLSSWLGVTFYPTHPSTHLPAKIGHCSMKGRASWALLKGKCFYYSLFHAIGVLSE